MCVCVCVWVGGHTDFFLRAAQLFHDVVTPHSHYVYGN